MITPPTRTTPDDPALCVQKHWAATGSHDGVPDYGKWPSADSGRVAQRTPPRHRRRSADAVGWPEPIKQPHGISSRGCVTVDGANRCNEDSAVAPVADLDIELGADGSVRSTLRRAKAEQFNYDGHVNARVG